MASGGNNEEDTSLLAKPATYSQILVGGIGAVSYEYRKAWRGDYFYAAPLYTAYHDSRGGQLRFPIQKIMRSLGVSLGSMVSGNLLQRQQ